MKSLLKVATTISLVVPIFWSVPSSAQPACTTGGISYLTGLASGCINGDKVYSDFVFSPNWNAFSTFGFTDNYSEHTFSGSNLDLGPGTYTYSYKVTIFPAGSNDFEAYRTGAASSSIPVPLASTKTLIGTPDGIPVVAIDTSDSPIQFLASIQPGPINFTGIIDVTSGRLDTITDSVYQANFVPQSSVPAPLPIFGVAAAFGSIRKLRRLSASFKHTE